MRARTHTSHTLLYIGRAKGFQPSVPGAMVVQKGPGAVRERVDGGYRPTSVTEFCIYGFKCVLHMNLLHVTI